MLKKYVHRAYRVYGDMSPITHPGTSVTVLLTPSLPSQFSGDLEVN